MISHSRAHAGLGARFTRHVPRGRQSVRERIYAAFERIVFGVFLPSKVAVLIHTRLAAGGHDINADVVSIIIGFPRVTDF